MEVVSVLRQQLADKVGQDRFELWFAGKTRIELSSDVLTVFVPNRFHQDWLRSHFRGDVESVAAGVVGSEIAVQFRVDRKLDEPAPKSAEKKATASVQQDLPNLSKQAEQTGAALAPFRRRFAKLADFVVGESNRVAAKAVEIACREPGSASPLFLHGPTGVGKTHLTEGLWSCIRQNDRKRRCVYLTSEQFTTFFLEALHGSGLPSFRRKHRGADLFILDDVQFLAGKRATLVELMSTIDALLRDGSQIVLTADRPLSDLKSLGAEFAARIAGGLTCSLETPEFATRVSIVERFARELDMNVPPSVQKLLAKHFANNARQLRGAVNRLHATCLAHDCKLDLSTATEALSDLIRQSAPVVGLAEIEAAICSTFELKPQSLRSQSKAKAVAQPRMLAMWLARKHTRSALSEIGDYFGRRAHSTVISAHKKVDSWMSDDLRLQLGHHQWTAQQALAEIEQRLQRVG